MGALPTFVLTSFLPGQEHLLPNLSKYLCGVGRCEGEPLFLKALKDSGGEGVSHTRAREQMGEVFTYGCGRLWLWKQVR